SVSIAHWRVEGERGTVHFRDRPNYTADCPNHTTSGGPTVDRKVGGETFGQRPDTALRNLAREQGHQFGSDERLDNIGPRFMVKRNESGWGPDQGNRNMVKRPPEEPAGSVRGLKADLVPVDRQDRRLEIGRGKAKYQTFDVFTETDIYHLD